MNHVTTAHDLMDSIDAQLLRLLQADGRMTIVKLAEAVGLSQASTHERVARLKREGFILGYEAVLNTEKLSSGMVVFAEISVNEPGPLTENIEVHASHVGMGLNPMALYAVADRLAQPPGQWKPFEPSGARRWFFRTPAAATRA